jgi:tellurite resistance protein TerC
MSLDLLLWPGFTLFIIALLAVDLGLFQRKPHAIGMREALTWVVVWIGLAMAFNAGIFLFHPRGAEAGLEFTAGYLVEKALSIDNVFVFILIFKFFHVPRSYQHKVLFLGIVGAIVLRMLFIVGGMALMERFDWVSYVFGLFLLGTGIGMLRKKDTDFDPGQNWLIRQFRRFYPVTERFEGHRFFVMRDGRRWATPLLITLLAIESSDILFAMDSIPAIFAITPDAFIVYTSNIFAMLGLRSLYFVVSGFMQMFHALHYGFASIILILGMKMMVAEFFELPIEVSLVIIVFILLACIIISLLRPRQADLKMLFKRTERLGLIPFRRLLMIENIIDLGELNVRDVMQHRPGVKTVDLALDWSENLRRIRETRYSRYPVIDPATAKPIGVLHIKDLALRENPDAITPNDLRALARPFMEVREDAAADDLLGRFQRRYEQIALVINADGAWTGLVTIEDILEELVGKIGDEFDSARSGQFVSLGDALAGERILLNLEALTLTDAIDQIVTAIPQEQWPAPRETIIRAARAREKTMSTYLGRGLAVPHARLDGIDKPCLAFARSQDGIPVDHANDRADLIFFLLTPTSMARLQPLLLADLVGLFESEYVIERLRKAESPDDVLEAIRAGQQIALD